MLEDEARVLGKASGFVQRQSKTSAPKFVETLVLFGNPTTLQLCLGGDENGNGPYQTGRVFFRNGVDADVLRFKPSFQFRATPDLIVLDIHYEVTERSSENASRVSVAWQGFFCVRPVCR